MLKVGIKMLDEGSIQKLGILYIGWVVVSGINCFLVIRKKWGMCKGSMRT